MRELYEAGKTTREISAEVDLSRETVRQALIASGVEARSRSRSLGKKRKPLSDEEVTRLRRLVGFDPQLSFEQEEAS